MQAQAQAVDFTDAASCESEVAANLAANTMDNILFLYDVLQSSLLFVLGLMLDRKKQVLRLGHIFGSVTSEAAFCCPTRKLVLCAKLGSGH